MAELEQQTLEGTIGYRFRDERLLVQALTHSSLAYEQQSRGDEASDEAVVEQDNERLEFLGDAVLGLVVAEALFRRFPGFHEGEWTRLRASLVSARHLARVAATLDLGAYLRLGRGEERSGGRKKAALLANAVEAIIAAIYLDGGFDAAVHFVDRHIVAPSMDQMRGALEGSVPLADHKSALQELLQAWKARAPHYVLKAEKGPQHHKRFLVEVSVDPGQEQAPILARGVGTTKKKAEQEAARRAFEKLQSRRPAESVEGGD